MAVCLSERRFARVHTSDYETAPAAVQATTGTEPSARRRRIGARRCARGGLVPPCHRKDLSPVRRGRRRPPTPRGDRHRLLVAGHLGIRATKHPLGSRPGRLCSGTVLGPGGVPVDPWGWHGSGMGRRKRNSGDWKVLTQACTSLLERLPELADEHVKRLHEGEPAYGRTVPYDQHWQEAHGAMRIGIEMISAPRASPRRDLRHADEMGRRRAEQGIPLELVVQSYRHAGRGVGRLDRGRGDVPAVWVVPAPMPACSRARGDGPRPSDHAVLDQSCPPRPRG
jgi:hypothetical protein